MKPRHRLRRALLRATARGLQARRQPATPPSITTPDALRLKIEPLADCGRYDSIRKIA